MANPDIRVHEYNTSFVLTTFLPYHDLPIFVTLLSILPANIPAEYRFLHPYIRSLTAPPAHAIIQAATKESIFSTLLNSYVLQICERRQQYPVLLSFWTAVMTNAVSGMLDRSRSGRAGVQAQNEQDVILRLLPTLNEGLAMKKVPELRVGCYMLLTVLAMKGSLEDRLLNDMMEALVLGWTADTFTPGLVCLSLLAQRRSAKQLSRRLTKSLMKIEDLSSRLAELSKQRPVDKLANGLCLGLVSRITKSGDSASLPIVVDIVRQGLLNDAQTAVIVKSLALSAFQLDDSTDQSGVVRAQLGQSLSALANDEGSVGVVTRKALEDTAIDLDDLELKLQASMKPKPLPAPADSVMEDVMHETAVDAPSFETLLPTLPTKAEEASLLSHSSSGIYDQLCQVFLLASRSADDIEQFAHVPILRQNEALNAPLYFSFFMRFWTGPHPVLARVAALQLTTKQLQSANKATADYQSIIPYAIVALGDAAGKVRKAAAELLLTLDKLYPEAGDMKQAKTGMKQWGSAGLYQHVHEKKADKWLSVDHAARFLREILMPSLEECVLDKTQIDTLLDKALNSAKLGHETPTKKDSAAISQGLRLSVLTYLANHVVHTPLYRVKLRLLAGLNRVRGVASTTRTKVLLPVLHDWTALDTAQVEQICKAEQVESQTIDEEAVSVVVASESDGLETLYSILQKGSTTNRPTLVAAVLRRIRNIWPLLKGDARTNTAQLLLDISLRPSANESSLPVEATELLRALPLSTDILLSFLNQLPTAAKLADKPPASKRRRVSHGEIARTNLQGSEELTSAIAKVTFVLQLIDDSNPGEHTPLLAGLFNALAELQHFKVQVGSELGYLQGLVLSSLLAITSTYQKDRSLKLPRSAVRADLLVDCVQKTSSPQLQNSALLIIASLADIAPELVLHSVMPIFTFMGSSVLRQNDEYSAHVIKQTISKVIPPLVASLRKQKGDPVVGAAELLLSFVAAYEHIPAHRRQGLFISLVRTLGPEDFLYALIAMLADKYSGKEAESIKTFVVELSGAFGIDVQLHTAAKLLDLIDDILKPKPTISNLLLSPSDSKHRDPHRMALAQLNLLPPLLSQERLARQADELLDRDDMESSNIGELWASLLKHILVLATSVKAEKRLHNACGDVLESILGLLSTSKYVKHVENLLSEPDEDLRRKILRSLEVRIDQESRNNVQARQAMLAFLPQLTAIIRESQDVFYKDTAILCVDKISEKYGKKDLEAVAAAAETIASDHCLGQDDAQLRNRALLCLTSVVDILREGIVPVLPIAIPKALSYLEESIEEDSRLHNAAYGFITALVEHLPYMVTGDYLDRLLEVSNKSAEADVGDEAEESRKLCLRFVAKRVDAKAVFASLEKNWESAAGEGPFALREHVTVLSTAIESHTKAAVAKNSTTLSAILLQAFDLRRTSGTLGEDLYSAEDIDELEGLVNAVAIKMIYKLNDATFRPIFSRLVEWGSTGLPKKEKVGRTLRLQSLFSFLTAFFSNLKSIVTSYASYILDSLVSVLKSANPDDALSTELWRRALKTLVECLKYDQDDFWQSPTHFDALAPTLTAQLLHASTLPVEECLIPAVVELAAAADSADHHKELNSAILKHMRTSSASVRLAAVKCGQGLTDRLGEEWLSMLPEMLPIISELQEDDDETVEKETHRWILKIEGVLGESLDAMLQ